MNILIACEESQEICKAMRERGHRAFSADLQECSGGHPEWHINGDVLPIINGDCEFTTSDGKNHRIVGQWDMLIAHPPCTYLSNCGNRWLYPEGKDGKLNEERLSLGMKAKAFFMRFINAKCDRIVVENPTPNGIYGLPQYTQAIQPYEHGDPWSKRTCLWIKGVPTLKPTKIIAEHYPWMPTAKHPGGSKRNSRSRSKTFHGVALAMAEQWG